MEFKECKIMVETQVDRKIKRLIIRNGLEDCNELFDDYCKEQGIVRHRIVVVTSWRNSLGDMMNKTIVE